jgi:hypothetical protein
MGRSVVLLVHLRSDVYYTNVCGYLYSPVVLSLVLTAEYITYHCYQTSDSYALIISQKLPLTRAKHFEYGVFPRNMSSYWVIWLLGPSILFFTVDYGL